MMLFAPLIALPQQHKNDILSAHYSHDRTRSRSEVLSISHMELVIAPDLLHSIFLPTTALTRRKRRDGITRQSNRGLC